MRVFVAGATGAIGKRLLPNLVEAGHEVSVMTRSPEKADALKTAGVGATVADGLDEAAVRRAIERARPEVVVHEMTAIGTINLRRFERDFAATNRLRTEGTEILLRAALSAGAQRFVAQSFAGWPYARTGGPVKSEQDPFDAEPPAQFRATLAAIKELERIVIGCGELEGLALRYGWFYGPATSLGPGGEQVEAVLARKFPVVGAGSGVWSFIHIDDAASATVGALRRGEPGAYNIVDDEPAPVSVWLPELARTLGAKPPRKVPSWLGRLAIGEGGLAMMNSIRGASNEKARAELGWVPRYPSWRDGFKSMTD
jgi:2-alkyl-3-oxoalkanoate reductase